jgi:molybdate transport system substrate-binding protein
MRGTSRLLLGLALAALAAACAPEPGTARVFVASSLGPAFEDLAAAFEGQAPGERIEVHAAGSPTLLLQLREGAPADLFAPADLAHIQEAEDSLRHLGSALPLATNRLALAVRRGNPHGVSGLADLERDDLVPLLCGPEVPAGRYARALLQACGMAPRSASDEPSARAVATKLRLGEADLGLVYATDVRATPELEEVPLSAPDAPRVEYRMLLLASGSAPDTARRFASFVTGPEGRSVLSAHGFEEAAP